jgi:hypothetical protein
MKISDPFKLFTPSPTGPQGPLKSAEEALESVIGTVADLVRGDQQAQVDAFEKQAGQASGAFQAMLDAGKSAVADGAAAARSAQASLLDTAVRVGGGLRGALGTVESHVQGLIGNLEDLRTRRSAAAGTPQLG